MKKEKEVADEHRGSNPVSFCWKGKRGNCSEDLSQEGVPTGRFSTASWEDSGEVVGRAGGEEPGPKGQKEGKSSTRENCLKKNKKEQKR